MNMAVTTMLSRLYAGTDDKRVRGLYARTMLSIGAMHYLVYRDFSRSLFGDAMVAFAGNEPVIDYLKVFLAGTRRDLKALKGTRSIRKQITEYLDSIVRRTM